jgi:hypothetical protein
LHVANQQTDLELADIGSTLISEQLQQTLPMYKTITFTTLELFEKVWETPLLKLAQEIGVSDVGLAKACRKAGIPLPSRGYWAKQPSGRPARPKPPTETGSISFQVLDIASLPPRPEIPSKVKSVIARLEVPQALVDPHPLVSRWLKQAQAAKTHEGHLMTDGKHLLRSHISAAQVDRSALIFDTLIKASEALGQCWTTTADNETSIEIDGEELKLLLKERITRITIPPPPPPPPKRGVPWTPDFQPRVAPQYEWVPTGELSLQLEADTQYGTRKNWADTKTKRLEARLTDVVDGLALIAISIKAMRARREEESRQSLIREARRLERARHEESQRRLRHILVKNSRSWQRAQELRAFIQATCEANANSPQHVQEQTALWVSWASAQADTLDPLRANSTSVTSLTVTIDSWFTGDSIIGAEKDWWSE